MMDHAIHENPNFFEVNTEEIDDTLGMPGEWLFIGEEIEIHENSNLSDINIEEIDDTLETHDFPIIDEEMMAHVINENPNLSDIITEEIYDPLEIPIEQDLIANEIHNNDFVIPECNNNIKSHSSKYDLCCNTNQSISTCDIETMSENPQIINTEYELLSEETNAVKVPTRQTSEFILKIKKTGTMYISEKKLKTMETTVENQKKNSSETSDEDKMVGRKKYNLRERVKNKKIVNKKPNSELKKKRSDQRLSDLRLKIDKTMQEFRANFGKKISALVLTQSPPYSKKSTTTKIIDSNNIDNSVIEQNAVCDDVNIQGDNEQTVCLSEPIKNDTVESNNERVPKRKSEHSPIRYSADNPAQSKNRKPKTKSKTKTRKDSDKIDNSVITNVTENDEVNIQNVSEQGDSSESLQNDTKDSNNKQDRKIKLVHAPIKHSAKRTTQSIKRKLTKNGKTKNLNATNNIEDSVIEESTNDAAEIRNVTHNAISVSEPLQNNTIESNKQERERKLVHSPIKLSSRKTTQSVKRNLKKNGKTKNLNDSNKIEDSVIEESTNAAAEIRNDTNNAISVSEPLQNNAIESNNKQDRKRKVVHSPIKHSARKTAQSVKRNLKKNGKTNKIKDSNKIEDPVIQELTNDAAEIRNETNNTDSLSEPLQNNTIESNNKQDRKRKVVHSPIKHSVRKTTQSVKRKLKKNGKTNKIKVSSKIEDSVAALTNLNDTIEIRNETNNADSLSEPMQNNSIESNNLQDPVVNSTREPLLKQNDMTYIHKKKRASLTRKPSDDHADTVETTREPDTLRKDLITIDKSDCEMEQLLVTTPCRQNPLVIEPSKDDSAVLSTVLKCVQPNSELMQTSNIDKESIVCSNELPTPLPASVGLSSLPSVTTRSLSLPKVCDRASSPIRVLTTPLSPLRPLPSREQPLRDIASFGTREYRRPRLRSYSAYYYPPPPVPSYGSRARSPPSLRTRPHPHSSFISRPSPFSSHGKPTSTLASRQPLPSRVPSPPPSVPSLETLAYHNPRVLSHRLNDHLSYRSYSAYYYPPPPIPRPTPLPSNGEYPSSLPTLGTHPPPLPSFGTRPPPLPSLGTRPPPLPSFGTRPPPLPSLGTRPPPLPSFGTRPTPLTSLRMRIPPLSSIRACPPSHPSVETHLPPLLSLGMRTAPHTSVGACTPSLPALETRPTTLLALRARRLSLPSLGSRPPTPPSLGSRLPTPPSRESRPRPPPSRESRPSPNPSRESHFYIPQSRESLRPPPPPPPSLGSVPPQPQTRELRQPPHPSRESHPPPPPSRESRPPPNPSRESHFYIPQSCESLRPPPPPPPSLGSVPPQPQSRELRQPPHLSRESQPPPLPSRELRPSPPPSRESYFPLLASFSSLRPPPPPPPARELQQHPPRSSESHSPGLLLRESRLHAPPSSELRPPPPPSRPPPPPPPSLESRPPQSPSHELRPPPSSESCFTTQSCESHHPHPTSHSSLRPPPPPPPSRELRQPPPPSSESRRPSTPSHELQPPLPPRRESNNVLPPPSLPSLRPPPPPPPSTLGSLTTMEVGPSRELRQPLPPSSSCVSHLPPATSFSSLRPPPPPPSSHRTPIWPKLPPFDLTRQKQVMQEIDEMQNIKEKKRLQKYVNLRKLSQDFSENETF